MLAAQKGSVAPGVRHRRRRHGRNALPEGRRRGGIAGFLAQFGNAPVWCMLAGAKAALLPGHLIDAAVIHAVILVNASVDHLQEGCAEAVLTALRATIAPQAAAMRAGARLPVPVEEAVPGDIVGIEAGDRVPEDLRLIRASHLIVHEAIPTGESLTSAKSTAPALADAPPGDRHSMAFCGALVAKGEALAVVVATGEATQIGQISGLLAAVGTPGAILVICSDRTGTLTRNEMAVRAKIPARIRLRPPARCAICFCAACSAMTWRCAPGAKGCWASR